MWSGLQGGTFVCQGFAYIDLEHPSARGLDYITFIQWQSEEFTLHEIGETWTFEFIIRFKNETPEGRYVVPITVVGEVEVCPDALPFVMTDFITFEVLKEPSNVSMEAWFISPCSVCVIPDNAGKAQPGTKFYYLHRICNLGTESLYRWGSDRRRAVMSGCTKYGEQYKEKGSEVSSQVR